MTVELLFDVLNGFGYAWMKYVALFSPPDFGVKNVNGLVSV